MTRPFSIHPGARQDLEDAILYYQKNSPEVVRGFIEAYEAGIAAMRETPKLDPVIADGVRPKLLRKFPYSLIYLSNETEVRLLAVSHQKREPLYWLGRS